MKELKRLVSRIFDLLAIVETRRNQPVVRQIQGLLREIISLIENETE